MRLQGPQEGREAMRIEVREVTLHVSIDHLTGESLAVLTQKGRTGKPRTITTFGTKSDFTPEEISALIETMDNLAGGWLRRLPRGRLLQS